MPVANFTGSPNNQNSPMLVQFMDSSTPINCPITAWDWDFGDGSAHSTIANPTHTFLHPGSPNQPKQYTIRLTVSSAAGTATKTATVTVKKP